MKKRKFFPLNTEYFAYKIRFLSKKGSFYFICFSLDAPSSFWLPVFAKILTI